MRDRPGRLLAGAAGRHRGVPVRLVHPGQQSAFVRHDGYWRPDQPYVDRLELINFSEDDARINALLSGQVDAIDQVPLSLTEVVGSYDSVRLLTSETGSWLPFTMRVDVAPFDDVRVRQALRLVTGRGELVNQVLSGQGAAGVDLYARFDPDYLDPSASRTSPGPASCSPRPGSRTSRWSW